MTQHTLALFRQFYDSLPPFFPEEIAELMKRSLNGFEQSEEINLEELENEMVKFGYHVWPYRQAHVEFINKTTENMGDNFLIAQLEDEDLQKKYLDLRDYGASWNDIYHGGSTQMFEPHERFKLSQALVEVKKKIQDFAKQDILGVKKDEYLNRVKKYTSSLDELKQEIDELKLLAIQEQDQPMLADHIKAKVKDMEHGLCLLGQELKYHEIKNAKEFFEGRKQELHRLRGIHEPQEIDFYE